MQLNISDIALHLVNIAVLYLLLRWLVYKPVRMFMDERAARVQAELDEANRLNSEAQHTREECVQRLAAVEEEAHEKLLDSSKTANEAAAVITAQAKEEAQAILEKAQAEAEQQRLEIQSQIRPQIADMAVEIAEKLLAREVNREDNRAFIDSFFQTQERVS